ncbi:MAG: flagellar assembly protein A [Desulfobacteraceae bacterium]
MGYRKMNSILLVDDEESVLKILRRFFKKNGFQKVVSALNGEQAVKILENDDNEFFLIISDQNMPGMSGDTFLEKSLFLSPESRRILMTGHSDLEALANAVNRGEIHQYILKPWDNNDLLLKVKGEYEIYKKIQDRKRLFKVTRHQTITLYRFASQLKKEEKAFRERIELKKQAVETAKEELIYAKKRAEQESLFPGFDQLLSRTININPENMAKTFFLVKKEFYKMISQIAEKYQIAFVPEISDIDAVSIEDNTYEIIDQILEILMLKMESDLSAMNRDKEESFSVDQYKTVPAFESLALNDGYITQQEFERARETVLDKSRKSSDSAEHAMDKRLLDMGFLLRNEVSQIYAKLFLIETRLLDRKFVEALSDKNLISEKDAEKAFLKQLNFFEENRTVKAVADILVDEHLLSSENRDELYSELDRAGRKATADVEMSSDFSSDYGAYVDLEISKDLLRACIRIPMCIHGASDIEPIKALIKKRGITYGIVDDIVIKGFLQNVSSDQEAFVVAKGDDPDYGENSRIVYHFSTEKKKAGAIAQDGSIDFRETDRYTCVKEGALLAELIPGKKGKPGRDVFGEPVLVKEVDHAVLRSGEGTALSKNGLRLYAKITGQPSVDHRGVISVLDELHVKGDVNFKTGNINFKGNVVVDGVITEGFTIVCEDLIAKGIDGGIALISGDLNVSTGIVNAVIETRGNIQAKYINHSTISGFGDVFVTREIMGSHITVSGEINNKTGRITSSFLAARKGLDVRQIGTEKAERSTIRMGVNDHIKWLEGQFDKKAAAVQKDLDIIVQKKSVYDDKNMKLHIEIANHTFSLEKAVKKKEDLKARMANIRDSSSEINKTAEKTKKIDEIIKDVENRINDIFKEQDELSGRIHSYEEQIKGLKLKRDSINAEKEASMEFLQLDDPAAVLKVNYMIHAGTKISGTAAAMIVKRDTMKSKFMEIDSASPDNKEEKEIVHQSL